MAGVINKDRYQRVRFPGGEGELIRVQNTPHGRMAEIKVLDRRGTVRIKSSKVEVING